MVEGGGLRGGGRGGYYEIWGRRGTEEKGGVVVVEKVVHTFNGWHQIGLDARGNLDVLAVQDDREGRPVTDIRHGGWCVYNKGLNE